MEPTLIESIFTYHKPTAEQAETYERINALFMYIALSLNHALPEGPGKTVAIRKLADARMAANAAVALEGKF